MKNIKWLIFVVLVVTGTTFTVYGQEEEKSGMGDMFVHPFLTHMALPDPPGEMSLRVTPFQERFNTFLGYQAG